MSGRPHIGNDRVTSSSSLFSPLPSEIVSLLRGGDCIAYVGSGPSILCYQSWPVLINSLCSDCGVSVRVGESAQAWELLDAAECAKSASSTTYFATLGKIFGKIGKTDPLYETLLRIPFKSIITPNLDPLLAHAIRFNDDWSRVMKYPDLDREYIRDRTIYHFHGLICEGEVPTQGDIVLAASEFEEAYGADGLARIFLLETFRRTPICFLGCKLGEPALQEVFEICKVQQATLQEKGGGKLPQRFIFLAREEFTDTRAGEHEQENKRRVNAAETHYADFGMRVWWYDAKDEHHSGLRRSLEQVAEIPAVPLKFGFDQDDTDGH